MPRLSLTRRLARAAGRRRPARPVLLWSAAGGWRGWPDGTSFIGALPELAQPPEVVAVAAALPDVAADALFARVRNRFPHCYLVQLGAGSEPGIAAPHRVLAEGWDDADLHAATVAAVETRRLRQQVVELEDALAARINSAEEARARHLAAWRFLSRGMGALAGSGGGAEEREAATRDLCTAIFGWFDVERSAPVPLARPADLGALVATRLAALDLPGRVRWAGDPPPPMHWDPHLLADLLDNLLGGVLWLPQVEGAVLQAGNGCLVVQPLPAPAVTDLARALLPFEMDPTRALPACPDALLLPTAVLQAQRQGLALEARRGSGMDGRLVLEWPGGAWPVIPRGTVEEPPPPAAPPL